MEELLDCEFDESGSKIKCFTNIEWISKKYKHKQLQFVNECKNSDICIVDSSYNPKEEFIRGIKINVDELNSDDETEGIEEFRKSLKSEEINVGVILFISSKNLKRLSNYTNIVQEVYPNMDGVVMTPARKASNYIGGVYSDK